MKMYVHPQNSVLVRLHELKIVKLNKVIVSVKLGFTPNSVFLKETDIFYGQKDYRLRVLSSSVDLKEERGRTL